MMNSAGDYMIPRQRIKKYKCTSNDYLFNGYYALKWFNQYENKEGELNEY